MVNLRSFLIVAGILAVASVPAFAGIVVTPEPKLGILTVLGVGAVVLVASKLKKR